MANYAIKIYVKKMEIHVQVKHKLNSVFSR